MFSAISKSPVRGTEQVEIKVQRFVDQRSITEDHIPNSDTHLAPTIDMDIVSSADESKVPATVKSESTTTFPLLILFDFDTETKVGTVLVPDTDDSATESSSDDKVKSGSSVTESASEDEDLAGDRGSVKQQLQSEVRFISKVCLTYANGLTLMQRTTWTVKDDQASIAGYHILLLILLTLIILLQPKLGHVPSAKMSTKPKVKNT